MGFAPLFVAGTFYYCKQSMNRVFSFVQIGNLGIIFCTVTIISFIILDQPIEQAKQSTLFVVFALSHSILYLLAFMFALFCFWFYFLTQNRKPFIFMLLALAIHAVADTLYTLELIGQSFDAVNYLNIYWLIAFALQYFSAHEQDRIITPIANAALETNDASSTPTAAYEALMPSLCIMIIIAVSTFHHAQLSVELFIKLAPAAFGLAVFLGFREWHMQRLEILLNNQVLEANRRLEQHVAARTQALSLSNSDLESFAYSVSHDLRAPLRAIHGFSSLLAEEYAKQLDEQGLDHLSRIKSNTLRMDKLIDGMLRLSRVSRHKLKREQINISKIAEQVAENIKQQYPKHKPELLIKNNLHGYADETILSILFENLLSNSWKFTSKTAAAQIIFDCVESQNNTIFYVRDNGVGFDMRYAEKLFIPFHRLHSQDEFKGTGIGLATAARIVASHNGKIWGESTTGVGASIYFTLA